LTSVGPANSTNILATQMINKIYNFYDYGQASAIGIMIMSIMIIFAIIYLKVTSLEEFEL